MRERGVMLLGKVCKKTQGANLHTRMRTSRTCVRKVMEKNLEKILQSKMVVAFYFLFFYLFTFFFFLRDTIRKEGGEKETKNGKIKGIKKLN